MGRLGHSTTIEVDSYLYRVQVSQLLVTSLEFNLFFSVCNFTNAKPSDYFP